MCGIFGIVNLDKKPVSFEILKEMGKTIIHRGPDNTGYFCNENIGIGSNRLSIIDLERGNQPIFNEDKSLCIVLNGEIYNYRELRETLKDKKHIFRTNSDTEVLVHLYEEYGCDMLNLLSGMFAFCILDFNKRIIFCARDRIGQKPFYYVLSNDQFTFASEIKAILKNVNIAFSTSNENLMKYFLHGYIPLDKTLFEGVKKLKPGHYIVINFENKKFFMNEYWDIDYNRKKAVQNKEFDENFEEIFLNSVRERMMSDVPLGAFLSGGIDSSLVVAFMKKVSKDIKTFNVAFTEKSFDESEHAKKVSELLKTEHYTTTITDYDISGSLRDILNSIDDPIADPSIIPTYIVSKFARQFVKVVLSGDGGDEIFGGYPKYYIHRYTQLYERLPNFTRKGFEMLVHELLKFNKGSQLNSKAKKYFAGLQYPPELRNQVWISPFLPDELKKLFVGECFYDELFNESYEIAEKVNPNLDIVDRAMYMDMKLTLNDLFLVKVDRASMLNSLEVRNPFLDYRLLDFFCNMPSSQKIRGLKTKYFLKKVASKYFPDEIVYRGKQGFGIPLAQWLRGGLKTYVLEMLEECKRLDYLNFEFIKKMVDDHMSLLSDNSYKIWALIVFTNLRKRYYE